MLQRSTIVIFCGILAHAAFAPPTADGSTSAGSDCGTFADPAPRTRPKFRYWIPDASVDPAVVASDVKAAGEVGMGGMELLGYYLYGGPPSNGAGRGLAAPVDWAEYGFGGEAWKHVLEAFVQATVDNGLILDLAIGPNQGTGVPAIENTDGLAWDIAAYNVSVPLGGSFDGQIPKWGTGTLLAAVTGLAVNSTIVQRLDQLAPDPGSLPGDLSLNRTQVTLSAESLTDVTDQVTADGHLRLDFSTTNATGIGHTLFAVYLFHTDYRAQDGPLDLGGPQTAPQSWLQNGSWSVDHFSSLGAKVITDFWDQHVLSNSTKESLKAVGNYAWEDSVEIEDNVFWTQNLSAAFQADHGYSIKKWLPILFHRNGHYENANPTVWWVTDEDDAGNGHLADYRATLGKGYRAYLTTLNEWAERFLRGFSAQISYNMPMDMLSNIPDVTAPECESLDFSDLIDGYRQYAGPAHLAERRIVSSECGAVRGEGFVQTLPELLWHVKRSYAGGINQFVFHGYPYSGDYGNTTWPVFTTFNYQYSNMHGPSQPAWADYGDQMDYVARNNYVLQAGVPKVDIAFWQKVTTYPGHIQLRTYEPTDLEEQGYSYEYLSPDNFDLPSAKVVDGMLAPDAQAFHALVVRVNDSLTVDGVQRLVNFARAGLPIILAGGVPSTYLDTYTRNAMDIRRSKRSLEEISALPNVHVTDSYLVAATLVSMGIIPRTRIKSLSPANATVFTTWRHDSAANIDFVFVYNDAMYIPQGEGAVEALIEFQSTGAPVEYNAWTGEQRPLAAYSTTSNSTIIPISLAGNQSTIIGFHCAENSTSTAHVAQLPSDTVGFSHAANGSLMLKVASRSAAVTLTNWTLIAELWSPPLDLYNVTGTVKTNTTHLLPQLVSWQQIPGLQNASGRGYYSTTFDWPADSSVAGAVLDFGWVYHTLRASLNGHALPPLDVTAPKVDIGAYLEDGENRLEVVVATPLGNAMIPIWYQLQTSGEGPGSPDASTVPPPVGQYGLQLDITVTPYREAVVA
ncbi:hypothetical protein LTR53_002146 [Teratosphaeriaceae sp. CCFEE 6253]|nr:hypothetical protein LTR53_002146 [Teratosphaeriaceae sp. CCFEE 6253]